MEQLKRLISVFGKITANDGILAEYDNYFANILSQKHGEDKAKWIVDSAINECEFTPPIAKLNQFLKAWYQENGEMLAEENKITRKDECSLCANTGLVPFGRLWNNYPNREHGYKNLSYAKFKQLSEQNGGFEGHVVGGYLTREIAPCYCQSGNKYTPDGRAIINDILPRLKDNPELSYCGYKRPDITPKEKTEIKLMLGA